MEVFALGIAEAKLYMGSKKDYTQPLWKIGSLGAAENNFPNTTPSTEILKLGIVTGREEEGKGCALLALFLIFFL